MSRVPQERLAPNPEPDRDERPSDPRAALQNLASALRSGVSQIENLGSSIGATMPVRTRTGRERQAHRQLLIKAARTANAAQIEELQSELKRLEDAGVALRQAYGEIAEIRQGFCRPPIPQYVPFASALLDEMEAAGGLDRAGRSRLLAAALASSGSAFLHFYFKRDQKGARAADTKQEQPSAADASSPMPGRLVLFPSRQKVGQGARNDARATVAESANVLDFPEQTAETLEDRRTTRQIEARRVAMRSSDDVIETIIALGDCTGANLQLARCAARLSPKLAEELLAIVRERTDAEMNPVLPREIEQQPLIERSNLNAR